MTEATKRPWRYQEESDSYTHIIRADGNKHLCQFGQDSTGQAEADARFSVRAVNAHDDMLAALKTIRDRNVPENIRRGWMGLSEEAFYEAIGEWMQDVARAAISKAEAGA